MHTIQKNYCKRCKRLSCIDSDEDYCFECQCIRDSDVGAIIVLALIAVAVAVMMVKDALHL